MSSELPPTDNRLTPTVSRATVEPARSQRARGDRNDRTAETGLTSSVHAAQRGVARRRRGRTAAGRCGGSGRGRPRGGPGPARGGHRGGGGVGQSRRLRRGDDPARARGRAHPPGGARRRHARRRHREGGRRHPPAPGRQERAHPAPLRRDDAPGERGQGSRRLLPPRGRPPEAGPRAAHGHLRPAHHHDGRPHGLLRLRGRRAGRGPGGGAHAPQGGRRLHQDRGHRRVDPNVRPEPRVLHGAGAPGDHRRGPAPREADRGPLHIRPGRPELPRRRRGHDHPLRLQRAGRLVPLPPRSRRAPRGGQRLGEPDPLRDEGRDRAAAGGPRRGRRAHARAGRRTSTCRAAPSTRASRRSGAWLGRACG